LSKKDLSETIYIVRPTKTCPRNRLFLSDGTEIKGVSTLQVSHFAACDFLSVDDIASGAMPNSRPEVERVTITFYRPRVIITKTPPKRKGAKC
jgi:hypothetical protein